MRKKVKILSYGLENTRSIFLTSVYFGGCRYLNPVMHMFTGNSIRFLPKGFSWVKYKITNEMDGNNLVVVEGKAT